MKDGEFEDGLSYPKRLYDEIIQLIIEVLPKDNRMKSIFYDTKKQILALGLPVEKIDCCILDG